MFENDQNQFDFYGLIKPRFVVLYIFISSKYILRLSVDLSVCLPACLPSFFLPNFVAVFILHDASFNKLLQPYVHLGKVKIVRQSVVVLLCGIQYY